MTEANSRIEEYFDIATTEWLPMAFSSTLNSDVNPHVEIDSNSSTKQELKTYNSRQNSAAARAALEILSGILVEKHQDHWLEAMLASPPSPGVTRGVEALSRAVRADQSGDPSGADFAAAQAGKSFELAGSVAGALRARVEEVYALHRTAQGDRCLAAANTVVPMLGGQHFAWLQAQGLLEQSICQGMVGQLDVAEKLARKAIALSGAAHFDTLHLRCWESRRPSRPTEVMRFQDGRWTAPVWLFIGPDPSLRCEGFSSTRTWFLRRNSPVNGTWRQPWPSKQWR